MFFKNIFTLILAIAGIPLSQNAALKNIMLPETSCSILTPNARAYLARNNAQLQQRHRNEALAMYAYQTNVTEENRKQMIAASTANANFSKTIASELVRRRFDTIEEEDVSRQVKILKHIGFNILPEGELQEIKEAISQMQSNYAKATVCSYSEPNKCSLSLEPDIQERLQNSRDPKELEHYWRQWYDAAGTPMKAAFAKYVQLSNKAAQMNGFKSYAEDWISLYDDPTFEENVQQVFDAILPFYKELHGYVRYRLRQHYGIEIIKEYGNIPMHLLGNMWGQSWESAIDLYTPYKEKPFVDVTAEMAAQQYTPLKMFQLGDEFFQSLNLTALPKSFWVNSVLEKPTDRVVVCHASAWDFYQSEDVRIKMCTEVSMRYLNTVHHELGHIQYYLQYKDQPVPFRRAPNPGFDEAVGDLIGLSVVSPKHLAKIGLGKKDELDSEARINELFKTALKKVVFLPFAYSMDKYRYAVFRGELDEKNWNCGFWKIRSNLSGIEPPVHRSEDDFDPPAKYHNAADIEYMRYFAAHIFQFQFLKAMCIKSGQYVKGDPKLTLDNCDFYGNVDAGNAFKGMLSLGASKHWTESLEAFTGDAKMDPNALLEYFEPLYDWLKAENKRLNVPIGWNETDKTAKCSEMP